MPQIPLFSKGPRAVSSIKPNSGFTLIELLVTMAVFGMIVVAFLSSFAALSRTTRAARDKAALASLSSQYMEVVRNMPYSKVGTLMGNPSGSLPDCPASQQPACPHAIVSVIGSVKYQIYYKVSYVHDPADPNVAAADYKEAKIFIVNASTQQVSTFVTTVAPLQLASANAGALTVQVINAAGQPVVGANVHIQSPPNSPTLVLDDTTDANGNITEVGLNPGVNAYRIIATKAGYSTDQTYPITAQNPNPINPDATIVVNQVTHVSLAIDLLSNLTIRTVNQYCQALNGVGVNVVGTKLIGTNPNIPKFFQSATSGPATFPSGEIDFNNIEWDTYTPTLATGSPYTLVGTSPVQSIDVLPNTSQTFTMYLSSTSTGNTLLVIVKDAATGATIEGATLHLQKGGSQPQDYYGTSGGSVWVQNDWSGGGGHASWNPSTPNTYYATTGNIMVNNGNGSNDVELSKVGNRYDTTSTSTLESSTFDSGTSATQYTTISWQPTSQDPSTFLGFQLAGNNDNATWNYVGPDGTANTYYTVPGTNINPIHNNNRYLRYKVFLSTTNNQKTPVLSTILMNFVSGCFAPGQYFFDGLTPSGGAAYDLTVSAPGYQTQDISSVTIGGYQTLTILLSQ